MDNKSIRRMPIGRLGRPPGGPGGPGADPQGPSAGGEAPQPGPEAGPRRNHRRDPTGHGGPLLHGEVLLWPHSHAGGATRLQPGAAAGLLSAAPPLRHHHRPLGRKESARSRSKNA